MIRLQVLVDDGTARPDLDQITFEISVEQWPELKKMKGIIVDLEVSGRNCRDESYQAHFYAPGNALCRNLSIYAGQSSDTVRHPSHLGLFLYSIGKSLQSVLVRMEKSFDFRGS